MTRVFLSAAVRHAVRTGPPRLRCLPQGWRSDYWPSIPRDLTFQQARLYGWSRQQQQQQFLNTHTQRHPICVRVTDHSNRYYSRGNIVSEQSTSTSRVDGLAGNSDAAEEVDLEALVELEVELFRQEGFPMPSTITPTQWQELLSLQSFSGRKRYLTFLFKNEMKKVNKKKMQEMNRLKREEEEKHRQENPPPPPHHIEYGLWKNSIFPKILESTRNHYYHTRVVQAMLHGQPLVVDMDFEEHMSSKERQNCAFQVQMMLSANRRHKDPYSLELHNAPATLDTMARLHRFIPTLYDAEFPCIINPKSYLDNYPREQLVYLTPHCQEELLEYDHNAVYIIGGIVDKSSGEPLSLAKAKREGLKMKKLPLDRYLWWGMGNKSLTFDQVINIMLDFKVTGDWSTALRHVPRRKLQAPSGTQRTREESLLRKLERKDRGFRNY